MQFNFLRILLNLITKHALFVQPLIRMPALNIANITMIMSQAYLIKMLNSTI